MRVPIVLLDSPEDADDALEFFEFDVTDCEAVEPPKATKKGKA